jgi:hypothetical protein
MRDGFGVSHGLMRDGFGEREGDHERRSSGRWMGSGAAETGARDLHGEDAEEDRRPSGHLFEKFRYPSSTDRRPAAAARVGGAHSDDEDDQ